MSRSTRSKAVTKPCTETSQARPRVKLWIELDGERGFCPGVCQILRAVEATGSIKDAALSIDRSYRFVWGKIKTVESALGYPLVETRIGGSQGQRSVLTLAGVLLVEEFESLRSRLFKFVDDELSRSLKVTMERIQKSNPRA